MEKSVTKYQHVQVGHLMLFVLLAVALLFVFISTQSGFDVFVIITMLIALLLLASFVSLKVVIDETCLRIRFGYGIFRKHFMLREIISARIVKNHWYFGWGIRVWFWPYMWIYNVSGFDAVEITMKNGKIYRIGTDKPTELEFAINKSFIEK